MEMGLLLPAGSARTFETLAGCGGQLYSIDCFLRILGFGSPNMEKRQTRLTKRNVSSRLIRHLDLNGSIKSFTHRIEPWRNHQRWGQRMPLRRRPVVTRTRTMTIEPNRRQHERGRGRTHVCGRAVPIVTSTVLCESNGGGDLRVQESFCLPIPPLRVHRVYHGIIIVGHSRCVVTLRVIESRRRRCRIIATTTPTAVVAHNSSRRHEPGLLR